MPQAKFLEVGKIVNTHGIKGEMRLEVWADSPESLSHLTTLYYDKDGTRPVKAAIRPQPAMALVTLDGVDTVQDASALRGTVLYAAREDFPLEAGHYFVCDIIGLTVVDETTGETYGTVTDVFNTGANDVYTMKKTDGGVCYIPAIPSIVKAIDIAASVMKIYPMAGLLDDEI